MGSGAIKTWTWRGYPAEPSRQPLRRVIFPIMSLLQDHTCYPVSNTGSKNVLRDVYDRTHETCPKSNKGSTRTLSCIPNYQYLQVHSNSLPSSLPPLSHWNRGPSSMFWIPILHPHAVRLLHLLSSFLEFCFYPLLTTHTLPGQPHTLPKPQKSIFSPKSFHWSTSASYILNPCFYRSVKEGDA